MEWTSETSILHWRKDWSSIRHDRMLFSRNTPSLWQKLFGWKLVKSYTRKCIRHLGPPPKDIFETLLDERIGFRKWAQKILNDQKDKLCNNSKVSNRTNQFQTQIMMIERSNPLLKLSREPRKVEEKRPVPRRSKHVLFMRKLLKTIERGHPLSAVTQITSQDPPKHVHLMTARASTLKIKQHMT